jgi:hypothetical protein
MRHFVVSVPKKQLIIDIMRINRRDVEFSTLRRREEEDVNIWFFTIGEHATAFAEQVSKDDASLKVFVGVVNESWESIPAAPVKTLITNEGEIPL